MHKYKIAFGLPIAVLLASTIGFSGPKEALDFLPSKNYIAVGATTSVSVRAYSKEPVNVIGGTVILPPELRVISVNGDDSIIDLWTKEPVVSHDTSFIEFAGGIISKEGFTGSGELFRFEVEAIKKGKAELLFEDATILAHDGKASETLDETKETTFYIRDTNVPSPDLNRDNRITILDVTIISAKLFGAYDPLYDFNLDGRVTVADILLLIRGL